jgi:transcriptional regulator with GAF, ATPase, and Fis domain
MWQVNRDRWLEIAEACAKVTTKYPPEKTLCLYCQELLGVSGVGIALMTGGSVAPLCASDERMSKLEDLQFTLGEGPSKEAFKSGRPVLEEHVDSVFGSRWPALEGLASADGIHGIFAFPVQVGAARIGVLTLYQQSPGALSREQHTDALITADVLSHVILSLQATAPDGDLARELHAAGNFRAEVHQASGMLSEQASISVVDALVRLRGHAYATNRPIAELASSVISGQLRLNRKDGLNIDWNHEG